MAAPVVHALQAIRRHFARVAYDATVHPGEAYYASLYLDQLRREWGGGGLRILDVGCGTGRLMVPVARMGHEVTGIDHHPDSLRVASVNARKAGVSVQLQQGDIVRSLQRFDNATFDGVMAIESLYVVEQYDQAIAQVVRVVKPGGMVFITHRPRSYYLLQALSHRHFDDAQLVATQTSGWLRKGLHRVFYNWHTREQIVALYQRLGMELLRLVSIGCASGFGPDPLAKVCDTTQITDHERDALRRIEANPDDDMLMISRYVLAAARKPVA
jgi:ubiquinone/menaquinone biosynthesis C-methylase UbiE